MSEFSSTVLPRNPYALSKMHKNCPVCDQPTTLEPGFYFGAAFVSYALNVLWLALSFPVIWFTVEHTEFNIIIGFIGTILVIFPYTFQLSRSLWLAVFVKYRGY